MLTPRQVELVQTTWEKCVPIADTAAALFYGRLFELDPSLKPLFTSDIKEQGKKLMTMITVVVRGLKNLDALVPAVQNLGKGHVAYGVKPEHYATVGAALLWTLDKGLGEAFIPEVKEAWTATYGILATVMKDAAATV
jgi:hemoglobin-like flavoprotein